MLLLHHPHKPLDNLRVVVVKKYALAAFDLLLEHVGLDLVDGRHNVLIGTEVDEMVGVETMKISSRLIPLLATALPTPSSFWYACAVSIIL